MKKVTDFIVNQRNFIFLFFVILTVFNIFLATNVHINRDITKYLPNTSSTKIGLNIMEKEFQEEKTSTLNIMFQDLNAKQKQTIYKELTKLDDVSEVAYDETDTYNKKNYTLYVLTVNGAKSSKEASKLYSTIEKNYKDYTYQTSGDVSDENKTVLPMWILVLAISSALVILIIMCDSYVEPFLFLFAIGMGVFLNKGTNIFFCSISSITNSIAAILQLALSMDYSIMLMNRYRQEKERTSNKVTAMKEALYKSFSSISSSSVTTIVGLLALVFMSFTIGRDLGLVLAKGVLFSLLTIFTCLPFLILTFDKWIMKTEKKAPSPRLTKLGKWTNRYAPFGLVLFLVIFIFSFCLKGNLNILFTDSASDEIGKIFKTNNQIAIIYPKEEEKNLANYLKQLEKDKKIEQVLGYSNTINEKLSYQNLKEKLNTLGSSTELDDVLIKMLYYHYYQDSEQNKMTLNDFVNFIQNEVYQNPLMSDKITSEMKANISKLSSFTNPSLFTAKQSIENLAQMFELDEDTIHDLLILKHAANNTTKMTLKTFIEFLNNEVLQSKYQENIDAASREKMKQILPFLDINNINKEQTYQEMAQLLGQNEESIHQLYRYYISNMDVSLKMSLSTFSSFVMNVLLQDEAYRSLFDEETIQMIQLLQTFSDPTFLNTKQDSKQMAILLGMDENMVQQLYLYQYAHQELSYQFTLKEWVELIQSVKNNTSYLDDLDSTILTSLDPELFLSSRKYTPKEFASLMQIEEEKVNYIVALYVYLSGSQEEFNNTPYEFITYLLEHKDEAMIAPFMKGESLNQLLLLEKIMTSSLHEDIYSKEDLASFLTVPEESVEAIYRVYQVYYSDIKLTPLTLIDFVLLHQNDDVLSSQISKEQFGEFYLLKNICQSVLEERSYDASNLAQLLSMDKENIELLYALYDTNHDSSSLAISYQEFVQFLNDEVVKNPQYASNLDASKREKIELINTIIQHSIQKDTYTKDELFSILHKLSGNIEKDLIDLLYIYYGSYQEYQDEWCLTVEEFVQYLNNQILEDSRFEDFISDEIKDQIKESNQTVLDAKNKLIGKNYGRIVLNTKYKPENKETFQFIEKIRKDLQLDKKKNIYLAGNTPMAYEMDQTFEGELNFITLLTIIFIFIIVAFTFKSLLIPTILVLLIQTSVYITMGILSFESGSVYFIALLIVQSILMGATIDYAILYTSYYIEARKEMTVKDAILHAYEYSIHTILTSASILSIVTIIIGNFSSYTTSMICTTISQGTICSTLLILFILPSLLKVFDKLIIKK